MFDQIVERADSGGELLDIAELADAKDGEVLGLISELTKVGELRAALLLISSRPNDSEYSFRLAAIHIRLLRALGDYSELERVCRETIAGLVSVNSTDAIDSAKRGGAPGEKWLALYKAVTSVPNWREFRFKQISEAAFSNDQVLGVCLAELNRAIEQGEIASSVKQKLISEHEELSDRVFDVLNWIERLRAGDLAISEDMVTHFEDPEIAGFWLGLVADGHLPHVEAHAVDAIESIRLNHGGEWPVNAALDVFLRKGSEYESRWLEMSLKDCQALETISPLLVGRMCDAFNKIESSDHRGAIVDVLGNWKYRPTQDGWYRDFQIFRRVQAVNLSSGNVDKWLERVRKEQDRYGSLGSESWELGIPGLHGARNLEMLPGVSPVLLHHRLEHDVSDVAKDRIAEAFTDDAVFAAAIFQTSQGRWYEEAVTKLQAEKEKGAAVLFLLAHYESFSREEGSRRRAVDWYLKAASADLPDVLADAADLGVVTNAAGLPKQDRPAGVAEAAERLCRSDDKGLAHLWSMIVPTLRKLELPSDRKIGAAETVPPQPRRSVITTGTPGTASHEIARMIQDGRSAEAVELAARYVPGRTLAILDQLDYSSRSPRSVDHAVRALVAAGLGAKLVEKVKTNLGQSRRDKIRYATLCDALGQEREALLAYEVLLKEEGDHPQLHNRHALLLLEPDPRILIERVRAMIEQRDFRRAENYLFTAANLPYKKSLPRLQCAELLLDFVPHVRPFGEYDRDQNLSETWLKRLDQSLAGAWRGETPSEMFLAFSDVKEKLREKSHLDEERRRIYADLVFRWAKVAPVSRNYFARLALAARGQQTTINKQQVRDLAIQEATKSLSSGSWSFPRVSESRSDRRVIAGNRLVYPKRDSSLRSYRNPVLWLADDAVESGNRGWFDDLSNLIDVENHVGTRKDYDRLRDLYFGDVETFYQAAGNDAVGLASRVLRMRPELSYSVSREKLVRGFASLNNYFAIEVVMESALADGYVGAKKQVDWLVEDVAGIDRDLLRKTHHPSQRSSGSALRNLISSLSYEHVTVFSSLYLERSIDAVLTYSDPVNKRECTLGEAVRQILMGSPLLDDVESFDVFLLEEKNSTYVGKLLDDWLLQFRLQGRVSEEEREKILLVVGDTDSFGAELIRALVKGEGEAGVVPVISAHLNEFRQASPDQQFGLACLVRDIIVSRELREKNPDIMNWTREAIQAHQP